MLHYKHWGFFVLFWVGFWVVLFLVVLFFFFDNPRQSNYGLNSDSDCAVQFPSIALGSAQQPWPVYLNPLHWTVLSARQENPCPSFPGLPQHPAQGPSMSLCPPQQQPGKHRAPLAVPAPEEPSPAPWAAPPAQHTEPSSSAGQHKLLGRMEV